MDTAIKHPVPDQYWLGHSDAQPWASECPDVKNYKWRLNPVWHTCTPCGSCGRQRVNLTCAVAAPAIDKVGPRPYHFRSGPTSGPTTGPQEFKKVQLKSPLKISICLITWHLLVIVSESPQQNKDCWVTADLILTQFCSSYRLGLV